ncbi:MAG: zinc-dependent peptidase [Nitrospirales bacterium]|nr:zinc-dependent peptidase [Nitrospirales bacterium]
MAGKRLLRFRRLKRLEELPFPSEWEVILDRNLPLYRHIPPELKEQLHHDIRIFLDEKRFEGIYGLEITEEMQVTIAAEACLLLLNRENRNYPGLYSILVYPHSYPTLRNIPIGGGGYLEEEILLAGESRRQGAVILAWDQVRRGGEGHNLTVHEFAHQLDQEDGEADGTPILGKVSSYAVWAFIMSRGYEHLRSAVKQNRETVLDGYGATNEAEFFAVATEAFFEKPGQLKEEEPELYGELKNFYNLDPAEWMDGRG